ncbi:hypothetical protein AB0873_31805 [Micromonospora sp. NPDC047707]|uniref:hypothetical protein n=1 Tax=Micromonospora sp. NPDC047707 TaxID=3154498 RepID=UPI0034528C53
MVFVQLIDYHTDRPEEVDRLLSTWITSSTGVRAARRTRVCRDRHESTHYIEIIEFDSREDAAANSNLPETRAVHAAFAPLCTDGPRFIDLDVQRDERL